MTVILFENDESESQSNVVAWQTKLAVFVGRLLFSASSDRGIYVSPRHLASCIFSFMEAWLFSRCLGTGIDLRTGCILSLDYHKDNHPGSKKGLDFGLFDACSPADSGELAFQH